MTESSTRPRGLACTRDFGRYQREWFADVQQRAADGEPVAVVDVDVPHEVLVAMDIPYVVAPWWASVCASKQTGPRYLQALADRGYPHDHAQYAALGFASSLAGGEGPWGGLPRPSLFITHGTVGPEYRITELWAEECQAPLFAFDRCYDPTPPRNWWSRISTDWDESLSSTGLDLMAAQIGEMAQWLTAHTGRRLDPQRLGEAMDLMNEQTTILGAVRDLVDSASPAPADISETIPATMIPQWHGGTRWGRDAAAALLAELRDRVDSGAGESVAERVRLMWIGNPLWYDLGLYGRLRASHGAAVTWSMYLAIAADGYHRQDHGRPFRTLAARHMPHRDLLSLPPWNVEWLVDQARRSNARAAVNMVSASIPRGPRFIKAALEAAGIPVLEINADAVDPTVTGPEHIEQQLGRFIESL